MIGILVVAFMAFELIKESFQPINSKWFKSGEKIKTFWYSWATAFDFAFMTLFSLQFCKIFMTYLFNKMKASAKIILDDLHQLNGAHGQKLHFCISNEFSLKKYKLFSFYGLTMQ